MNHGTKGGQGRSDEEVVMYGWFVVKLLLVTFLGLLVRLTTISLF